MSVEILIDAEGKVVFAGAPGGILLPRSIGGRVQMDGQLTFGEVSVRDPRVAFMFGATTGAIPVPLCHIAGRCRGRCGPRRPCAVRTGSSDRPRP